MTIRELAAVDVITYNEEIADRSIEMICTNTEEAIENKEKNPLFICISGSKYDTHNDIPRLISEGITDIIVGPTTEMADAYESINIIRSENTRKTLALASKLYFGCPDEKMKMIGITGTKGKTTVSYMVESVLRREGKNCGIIGTNGVIYNGNTYESENTTPGAFEYYRHLKNMADLGVEYVIAEITSQSLKQYRTYGTTFDVAAFTNLYPDHISPDEHSDFDEYRKCKGKIFENCRCAVINMDDKNSTYFTDLCRILRKQYVLYSTSDKKADHRCTFARTKCTVSRFRFMKHKITIPLPGDFNIHNAMCAAAVLCELGVDAKSIAEGLSFVKIPGRCEKVENPADINIIIDYAHNKESLENILKALRKNCRGRLYCVFGAGGDRSRLRRYGMGEAACEYADFSVITSDNPRTESPDVIISDILRGFPEDCKNYIVIPERRAAIHYALKNAKKGDTVLLAGKGTQNYEEVNGVKYPFNEREAVSQYYNSLITQQ